MKKLLKIWPAKQVKKYLRIVPKLTKNHDKITEKMPKVLEIDRKSSSLRGQFFHDFLSGQKMEKSGTKTKWESAGIVQG